MSIEQCLLAPLFKKAANGAELSRSAERCRLERVVRPPLFYLVLSCPDQGESFGMK